MKKKHLIVILMLLLLSSGVIAQTRDFNFFSTYLNSKESLEEIKQTGRVEGFIPVGSIRVHERWAEILISPKSKDKKVYGYLASGTQQESWYSMPFTVNLQTKFTPSGCYKAGKFELEDRYPFVEMEIVGQIKDIKPIWRKIDRTQQVTTTNEILKLSDGQSYIQGFHYSCVDTIITFNPETFKETEKVREDGFHNGLWYTIDREWDENGIYINIWPARASRYAYHDKPLKTLTIDKNPKKNLFSQKFPEAQALVEVMGSSGYYDGFSAKITLAKGKDKLILNSERDFLQGKESSSLEVGVEKCYFNGEEISSEIARKHLRIFRLIIVFEQYAAQEYGSREDAAKAWNTRFDGLLNSYPNLKKAYESAQNVNGWSSLDVGIFTWLVKEKDEFSCGIREDGEAIFFFIKIDGKSFIYKCALVSEKIELMGDGDGYDVKTALAFLSLISGK